MDKLSSDYKKEFFQSIFDKSIPSITNIIALGEVSHGGYEPLAFKSNMVKYLVENLGYRKILMEQSETGGIMELRKFLNKYNLNDTSYIKKWIAKRQFPKAISSVYLELFSWVKKYNTSHPKDMVHLMGFELTTEKATINLILNGFIVPFEKLNRNKYVSQLSSNIDDLEKVNVIHKWFKERDSDLVKSISKEEYDWLRFYVTNTVNGSKYLQLKKKTNSKYSDSINLFRDSLLANNIRLLKKDVKTIIWAHNAHVLRASEKYMGNFLDRYYGKNYFVVLTEYLKFASVEVMDQDAATDNQSEYSVKVFPSYSCTAANEISRKLGVYEGVFFKKEIDDLNIPFNTNVIDVAGKHLIVNGNRNSFDALVVFKNIYYKAENLN